jgi:hypothetical protein
VTCPYQKKKEAKCLPRKASWAKRGEDVSEGNLSMEDDFSEAAEFFLRLVSSTGLALEPLNDRKFKTSVEHIDFCLVLLLAKKAAKS